MKKREKPPVRQRHAASDVRSGNGEIAQPKENPMEQSKEGKEPDIAKGLEKLEEKITRNIEEFRKIDAKIRETDEETEDIETRKRTETLGEKAKKAVLFCPKICVEANVCRFPKAICRGCGKTVDVWKSAGKAGMRTFGDLAGKCRDSLSTGMRLPLIRMKIHRNFKRLGDRAYRMYLEGEKDVMKNDAIAKIIEAVRNSEKRIEKMEARLARLNEQSIVREQNA